MTWLSLLPLLLCDDGGIHHRRSEAVVTTIVAWPLSGGEGKVRARETARGSGRGWAEREGRVCAKEGELGRGRAEGEEEKGKERSMIGVGIMLSSFQKRREVRASEGRRERE